jgi:NADP-dependent 3-hydroxy acid dehydrogenase YdfG
VTGGYTGIGYETCKVYLSSTTLLTTQALLEHRAKVYIAGRSETKAEAAITKLKRETGSNKVHFLKLDLADIPSAATAARELASKEPRLDLLFNNGYNLSILKFMVVEYGFLPNRRKQLRDTNFNGQVPHNTAYSGCKRHRTFRIHKGITSSSITNCKNF